MLELIDYLFEYYKKNCENINIKDINYFLQNSWQDSLNNYYENLNENIKIMYSIIVNKNKCWNYENEWRLIAYNTNMMYGTLGNAHSKIGKLQAQSLYLGEYINQYDKIALLKIADNKKIPVYQMKTKMYKNYCKLVPILIQE